MLLRLRQPTSDDVSDALQATVAPKRFFPLARSAPIGRAQGRVNPGWWGKVPKAIEAAVENVPMVTPPEENDDDEPQYTAWLDLPRSTREPMTAKDANAARKALVALDDRTPQQPASR